MFAILRNCMRLVQQAPLALKAANLHILAPLKTEFLKPIIPAVTQICGLKVKGRLELRCRECYFVIRQQRWYVMCKKHGRHKQMSMVKDPKNTWILTHSTMGKVRQW